MPRLRIQGLDNFYIPSFASKLLLKEVICKKTRQKRLFSTESSTYRDFSHLNAYSAVLAILLQVLRSICLFFFF